MTIQQAYNKGLDDAENAAIDKLTKALAQKDDGPFNNPKMEALRQRILTFEQTKPVVKSVESIVVVEGESKIIDDMEKLFTIGTNSIPFIYSDNRINILLQYLDKALVLLRGKISRRSKFGILCQDLFKDVKNALTKEKSKLK